MSAKKAAFIFLAAAALLLAVGLSTSVYLGDEVVHFRIASYYYEGGRPVWEPFFLHVPEIGYRLAGPVFWSAGLSLIWKLFQGISQWTAQVYQIFYFLLLLWTTYALSRELEQDEKSAVFNTWVAASCPMLAAFSIMLYLDVPASALSLLVFLLLFRKKHVLGGVVYACLIMTKESGFFFGPGIVLAVLLRQEETFRKKIANLFLFFGTALLVLLPDIWFRYKNFGFVYYTPPHAQYANKELTYWYTPASIDRDPVTALSYLGGMIPLGVLLLPFLRRFSRKEAVLIASFLMYCGFFVYFFPRTLDMRYFMLGICLLIPVLGRAFARIQRPFFRGLLYLIMTVQFLGVCGVLAVKRKIPEGIQQGFAFVRENTPEKSVIFYPAENIINHTGRPMVWLRVLHMQDLFWSESPEKVLNAVRAAKMDYIAVPEERVYDDSKVRHTGGYPRSFVNRLKNPGFPFLKEIYSNPQIAIWEIREEDAV